MSDAQGFSDQVILPILQDIGCVSLKKKPVESISQFEDVHIYDCSAQILRVIDADQFSSLPASLPHQKAARFRCTTALANAIKEMGYSSELGYEAFLYPDEKDMRKLLIWLVDKMPKVGKDEESEQVAGSGASVMQAVKEAFRAWLQHKWTAVATTKAASSSFKTCHVAYPADIDSASKDTRIYWKNFQLRVHEQPQVRSMVGPSLMERHTKEWVLQQEREREWETGDAQAKARNAANLKDVIGDAFRTNFKRGRGEMSNIAAELDAYKGGEDSAFARRAAFGHDKAGEQAQKPKEESEEEKQAKEDAIRKEREDRIKELQDQLAALKNLNKKMQEDAGHNTNQGRQLENQIMEIKETIAKLEAAYKVKKEVLDLLPNADENIKKLQEIADAAAERLVELALEWEKHRLPLIQKYRKRKTKLEERKGEVGAKVEQIKRMRAEMKQKAADLKEKDAIYKQVLDELNKLPKSINRHVYVKRIMDIVKNLDKQKDGIKKVLIDVRQMQKDINSISKTQGRSFSIADEVIYQSAKTTKDPVAVATYKNVLALRDGFVDLVKNVEDTGKCKNEITNIEAQIEALAARSTDNNMKRVLEDLKGIKEDNSKLKAALKAVS